MTQENFIWQYYSFSGDEKSVELQKRFYKLSDRFSSMSRKDPNFSNVQEKLIATEQEIADKQKQDWLDGHGSPYGLEYFEEW